MANSKISALTAATTPLAGTETLPVVQSSTTKKVSVADLTAGRSISTTGVSVTGVGSKITFDTTGSAGANWIYTTNNYNLTLYAGRGSTVQIDLTTDYVDSYIGGVRQTRLSTTGLTLDTGNLIQGTAAKGINFTANTPAAGMTSQLLNWYEEGTWTPNQGAGLTLVGAFSSAGTYTRIGRQVFIRGSVSGATSVAVASAGAITTNLPYSAAADATGTAINAADNASSILRVSSATLTAATAIAATTTITFSAVYSV